MSELKTAVVTGATSGLGFESAKKIAADPSYRVILACRNNEKAKKAKEDIEKSTSNPNIETMTLDTSSLKSVRDFVSEFKEKNIKLDVLICNAGISPIHSGTSEDGFELVFATNYLGHFLLVNLLLPYMSEEGRIINVSSDMHNPPGGIEWRDPELLAHPKEDDRRKYSYSKLSNIYFTYELNKRLRKAGSKITVNAFNPGMMNTNFSGGHYNPAHAAMVKLTMPQRFGDLEKSSDALAKVATGDEFKDVTGKYFDRSTKYIKSSELSYNDENMLDLWNKSVAWTGLEKDETLKGIL